MKLKLKIFIVIFLLVVFCSSLVYASNVVTNPSPTVTHTSSSEGALSISDIIDIILIAVCIVLIFLGIAILIRCK